MRELASPSGVFSARINSVQLLLNSLQTDKDEQAEFDSLAKQISSAKWVYESKVVADSYAAYAALLEIAEVIVKKEPYMVTYFIEPFTRAKEWSATAQLTATTLSNIPNTVRTKHQRLFISQWDLAAKFEQKIQSNDFSKLNETAIEFNEISDNLHKDLVNERASFPFGGFFSED